MIMPEIKGIFKDGNGRVFIWFKEEDNSLQFSDFSFSEVSGYLLE